jgi:hypothetical protein
MGLPVWVGAGVGAVVVGLGCGAGWRVVGTGMVGSVAGLTGRLVAVLVGGGGDGSASGKSSAGVPESFGIAVAMAEGVASGVVSGG